MQSVSNTHNTPNEQTYEWKKKKKNKKNQIKLNEQLCYEFLVESCIFNGHSIVNEILLGNWVWCVYSPYLVCVFFFLFSRYKCKQYRHYKFSIHLCVPFPLNLPHSLSLSLVCLSFCVCLSFVQLAIGLPRKCVNAFWLSKILSLNYI